MLVSFGIGKWLWKTQEIVSRNPEMGAYDLDVLQAGFVLAPFQIRNFALGHVQKFTQLRLIQFLFFPEKLELLTKCHVHSHHRLYFIIDRKNLFHYRQEMSIMKAGGMQMKWLNRKLIHWLICSAGSIELRQVVQAVVHRYAELFAEEEVIFLSLPKRDSEERRRIIQAVLGME